MTDDKSNNLKFESPEIIGWEYGEAPRPGMKRPRVPIWAYKIKKKLTAMRIAKIFLFASFAIIISAVTIGSAILVATGKFNLLSLAGISGKEVKVLLYPEKVNEKPGKSFTVLMQLSGPENKKLGSVLLTLAFDKSHLRLEKIDNNILDKSLVLLRSSQIEKSNTTGLFKILYGAQTADNGPSGKISLSSFTFTVLKEAESKITVDAGKSQIAFLSSEEGEVKVENEVLVNTRIPTATPPATPVQTSAPIPSTIPTSPSLTNTPIPTHVPLTNTPIPHPTNTPTPLPPTLTPQPTITPIPPTITPVSPTGGPAS